MKTGTKTNSTGASKSGLAIAALSLVSISGAASGSQIGLIAWDQGQQIPESIASPEALAQHEMAQRLLPSLPVDQRAAIEAMNGFGAELASCNHVPASNNGRRGVINLPSEPIDINDPAFRAEMTSDQLAMLDAMQQSIEDGYTLPQTCFTEDVNPKFIEAINQLFERSMGNNNARFQGNDRWTVTATDGAGIQQGDPITLTYSFVPDGTFIPDIGIGTGSGNSVLFSFFNGIYAGGPAEWQPLFAQVFDRWAELIGVSYVYEPNDDGANTNQNIGVLGVRGDIRIGAFNLANDSINGGTLAYNNFPNDGDMIFDTDNFFNNRSSNSRRLRNVAAHEHGHGLGMLHVCPLNQTKLMEPIATTAFDGPQLDDILGGQRRYGDNFEPASDSPSNPPVLGSFGVNDFAIVDNVSIDDNLDFDFYKFTLTTPGEVQITVSPAAASYQQGPQTGNCNTGSVTDYNAIHDLSILLLEGNSPFAPVAAANATSAGEIESLITSVFTPGDYLIQIDGDSTNNIQRYELTLFINSVGQCSTADVATPFGVLNFFDINAYLTAFNSGNLSIADVSPPGGNGILNFFDINDYLTSYNAGCP